jgi:hypothetical protein
LRNVDADIAGKSGIDDGSLDFKTKFDREIYEQLETPKAIITSISDSRSYARVFRRASGSVSGADGEDNILANDRETAETLVSIDRVRLRRAHSLKTLGGRADVAITIWETRFCRKRIRVDEKC